MARKKPEGRETLGPKASVDTSKLLDLMKVGRTAATRAVKGGLSQVGSEALASPTVWFSTGSLSLDRLCRGYNPGGFPAGRVVHLAGEWSTGKSLVLDHLFKSCLEQGGLAMCSETEGSRDPHFADAIGLDLGGVEIQRPESIEEMIDMGLAWHDAIRGSAAGRKVPILWGIDSLDSTEAQKAQDSKGMSGSHGWQYGGGRSEALGAGLRKIVQRTARYPTTLVMLNQTRDNVGVMFGPAKRTSLGNAPHFYASLEIMLSPSPLGYQRAEVRALKLPKETMKRLGIGEKDRGAVVGRWVRATVSKTKIAPTVQQQADFYINFLEGVHRWGGLLGSLVRQGAAVVDPDGEAVTHGSETFPTQKAWLTWLAQNEKALATSPQAKAVATSLANKVDKMEDTDAEGE
jgi:recombination protein RecA